MPGQKNRRPTYGLRWGMVSMILIMALVLPAAQPSAFAQACQGDDCATVAASTTPTNSDPESDVARFTSYAQISSTAAAVDGLRPVEIEWATAYETFNAGFNIVVETDDGFVAVNDDLIPSEVIDSLEPQFYSATVNLAGDEFYLEHVTIEGESHRTGPFTVGETVGEVVEPVETDWASIRAESEALAEAREAERIVEINAALNVVRGPAPSPDEPLVEQSAGVLGGSNIYLPMIGARGDDIQSADADAVDVVPGVTVNLLVRKEGLYRVTYEDIHKGGSGPNLLGVPSAYLALTHKGVPVRIRMVAAQTWGPGAYFEFVGEGIDTLYTDENVYVLQVDRSKAFRTYRNMRGPDLTQTAPSYYHETVRFEENVLLSYSSPADEPWAWGFGNVTGSTSASATYTLNGIDQLSSTGPAPSITTEVWGYSPGGHRVFISINGTNVQDVQYSGDNILQEISTELDNGLLQSGSNEVSWEIPGLPAGSTQITDAGVFEAITVEYSRAFVARNGALSFESDAKLFTLNGLPSSQVSVFSYYRNRLWKLDQVQTSPSGGVYTATFPGWGADAKYFVAANDSFTTPVIEAGRLPVDITSVQNPDDQPVFVIISHPDFLVDQSALYNLVAARTAEGYAILVVDVMDVYAQFSHGIFDAQAIKDYITYIIEMGTDNIDYYFLLVGDDQADYRHYQYPDAISFIPSLYGEAYSGQNFMPVDPLYTDSDGDNVMDAPIGRFPVNTTRDLSTVVQKTLAYSSQNRTALFAADDTDGPNYKGYSRGFADKLPDAWKDDTDPVTPPVHIFEAFLDDDTTIATRQKLISTVNNGVGLVNYLGHSAIRNWAGTLFRTTNDLPSLTNIAKPTLVIQYGCYPSMYVNPSSSSMSGDWMTAINGGSAASLGAVGLTSVSSDVALGNEFSSRVALPGKTIGMAFVEAKQAMGYTSSTADVILGWVLFGDPTLKVEP